MEKNRNGEHLGRLIKQRRLMMSLTLRELATISGISSSHLGRIERGERFPSASVLRRIARPLGFEEGELFQLAGYLTLPRAGVEVGEPEMVGRLDPYVGLVLGQEAVPVQRTVIGILNILKSIARAEP
jgi:transcriptional regulator with XRE-family HTH domain